jgi:hypothetical protein
MHNEDFEKNRIEYVMLIENQLRHAKHELAIAKAAVTAWEPKFSTEMNIGSDSTKVSLTFGGKVAAFSVNDAWLNATSATDACVDVVDKLVEAIVAEKLRELLRPQLEHVKANIQVRAASGKW